MEFTDEQLKPLVDAVVNKACVVFVGAGISVGGGYPTWAKLLNDLAQKAKQDGLWDESANLYETFIKRGELLAAAQRIAKSVNEKSSDKKEFYKLLKKTLAGYEGAKTKNHELIAQIPFSEIITTNYDKLLESSFNPPLEVITHADKQELGNIFNNSRDTGKPVIKLHGDIDRPDTLILLDSDYQQLIADNNTYNSFIKSLFTTSTILYIGYSLGDPDINLVTNEINTLYRTSPNKGYALIAVSNDDDIRLELLKDKTHNTIEYITYDPQNDPKNPHGAVTNFLQQLLDTLPDSALDSVKAMQWDLSKSPFPGLRAFTEDDAPIYRGRNREINDLYAKLLSTPFVAVVGASGSGKSSLVRAGLIPKLKNQITNKWEIIKITPDRTPFINLKQALKTSTIDIELNDTDELGETMVEDILKAIGKGNVLIFIDQFEELFTRVPDQEQALRKDFLEMLQLLSRGDSNLRIVVTIRADFYHHLVDNLPENLDERTFTLTVPKREDLEDMITGPAKIAGIDFDDKLVDKILEDTDDSPGSLALMAYLLDELYQRRKGNKLTFEDYYALGGVEKAIGKRAEEAFNDKKLSITARKEFSHVFQKLIVVQLNKTTTRRRADLSIFENNDPAKELIKALTDARLLITDEKTVEVAHEALFLHWDRLRDWIDENSIHVYRRQDVENSTEQWVRNNKAPYLLWPHERQVNVKESLQYLDLPLENLDKNEQEFLIPEAERIIENLTKTERIEKYVYDFQIARLQTINIVDETADQKTRQKQNEHAILQEIAAQLGAMKNENEDVRDAAIAKLGDIGDERVVKPLIELLEINQNDSNVQNDTIVISLIRDALTKLKYPESREYFASVVAKRNEFKDPGEKFGNINFGIRALGLLGFGESFDLLAEISNDATEESIIRSTAVTAIANLDTDGIVPLLIKLAIQANLNKDIRIVAIDGLGRLGNKEATEPLLLLLQQENSEDFIRTTMRALGRLHDTRVFEPLKAIVKNNKLSPDLINLAIHTIAHLDTPEKLSFLLTVAKTQNDILQRRLIAIKALSYIHDDQVFDTLISYLREDKDPEIRSGAANALGQFGDRRATPMLLYALENDNDQRFTNTSIMHESVQIKSIEALGALADPKAFEPLSMLFKNTEHQYIENYLVKTLRLCGEKDYRKETIKLFQQEFSNKPEQGIKVTIAAELASFGERDGQALIYDLVEARRHSGDIYKGLFALGYYNNRRSKRLLRSYMNTRDIGHLRQAILSLLRLSDEYVVDWLQGTQDRSQRDYVVTSFINEILFGKYDWLYEDRDLIIKALKIANTQEALLAVADWEQDHPVS